jgi:hypothetical protein
MRISIIVVGSSPLRTSKRAIVFVIEAAANPPSDGVANFNTLEVEHSRSRDQIDGQS